VVLFILATTPFSYKNQNQGEAIELLNAYDRIKLSFPAVVKLASKGEYEDYNS
jgi:hypothetical protein